MCISCSLLTPPLRWPSLYAKRLRGYQGIFTGCVWHTSIRQLIHTGRLRRWNASSSCGLYFATHRLMVEGSTSTPRSAMSSSTWRVLSGYATYQRTPLRMTSFGKRAPLKLIAIVGLPHESPRVIEGEHTVNHLK